MSGSVARSAWLDEKLYPFESHLLEIEGNKLHFIDEGTGPTLLFVHGNPARAPTWILPRQIIASGPFLAALEAHLPEFSGLPALIIWGDKDDAFGAPELAHWQQLVPSATTVILPGVGHFAASEAPAEFAAAIRAWKT